jgi:hypothetical protein
MDNGGQGPEQAGGDAGRFIQAPIDSAGGRARTTVSLGSRFQGWLEIPHGGALMSMVLELAHRGLTPSLLLPEHYPIRASFRLGGPSLVGTEDVEIGVEQQGPQIHGWVRKTGQEQPSVTSIIECGTDPEPTWMNEIDRIATTVERAGREAKERGAALPYSRNCFVCGSERQEPGLERRFHCVELEGLKVAFTFLGLDPDDQEKLASYRLEDGQIHPGVLAAILDETLGWGGFVHTRQGGVTVKLEVVILRPVEPDEKMLCFGACSGTRGRSADRLVWYSTGGIVPIGEEEPSPIMLANGQWLVVPRLTEEMRTHLLPDDWGHRWFGSETA